VALDASDTIARFFRGVVHYRSSDGQAMLPVEYAFVPADEGKHTFSVTLETADVQTLTVAENGRPRIAGSAHVRVEAVAATQPAIIASTHTPRAGTPITVEALDPFGVRAPRYGGTVHSPSTDRSTLSPSDYTVVAPANGKHVVSKSVTRNTVGSERLKLVDVSNGSMLGRMTVDVPAVAAPQSGASAWSVETADRAFGIAARVSVTPAPIPLTGEVAPASAGYPPGSGVPEVAALTPPRPTTGLSKRPVPDTVLRARTVRAGESAAWTFSRDDRALGP
jgi:hypothetical protein